MGAGGVISNSQGFFNWPVLGDGAAVVKNRAQCILEALAVVSALTDLHVGGETKECASPIRSAPGMGNIQPAVVGIRLPLGHILHKLLPDFGWRKLSHLCAGDRLNIGGKSLFDPMMVSFHRRKGEMNHLVRYGPVVPQ